MEKQKSIKLGALQTKKRKKNVGKVAVRKEMQ